MNELIQWWNEHETLLAWLGAGSAVMFVVSLLLIPWVCIRLPSDYFMDDGPLPPLRGPLHLAMRMGKNLLGALLVLLGFVMLFIPGQGVLSMLIGVSLLDFPGKRRIQLRILSFRGVRRSVNWLRRKAERAPLAIPDEARGSRF